MECSIRDTYQPAPCGAATVRNTLRRLGAGDIRQAVAIGVIARRGVAPRGWHLAHVSVAEGPAPGTSECWGLVPSGSLRVPGAAE